MIIIVSNRNIQGVPADSKEPVEGDETLFGEDFNVEGGPGELRVAIAEEEDDKWKLTLLPDTSLDRRSALQKSYLRKLW